MSNEADRVLERYAAFRRAYRADELATLRADVEREHETPRRFETKRIGSRDVRAAIHDEHEWMNRPGLWAFNEEQHFQFYDSMYDVLYDIVYDHCKICLSLARKTANTAKPSSCIDRYFETAKTKPFIPRWRTVGCTCVQENHSYTKACETYWRGMISLGELGLRRKCASHFFLIGLETAFLNAGSELLPELELIRRQYERWLALELLGPNPFRPIECEQHWRTENVVGLAESMHASADYDAMPILADALEEAGCEHAAILTHCRQTLPHHHGCWVVSLILNDPPRANGTPCRSITDDQ